MDSARRVPERGRRFPSFSWRQRARERRPETALCTTLPDGIVYKCGRFPLSPSEGAGTSEDMSKTRRTPKHSTDNRKAVATIRVSTEEQNLGPDAQRAEIVAWAARNGVEVVAWYEDRVSGAAAIGRRPGLMAALDALVTHGAGLLVVAKRDRLARDTMLAAMIERQVERVGARVVSAAGEGEGDDPASKLMRTMIDAFAEYERALIALRTKSALAVKSARGEKVGGAQSYGAADGIDAERTETERMILAVVEELRAAGMPIRAIADELAARGFKTRKGGSIAPTQVARLIARAA